MRRFLKDESGQGATEYILLLVVVIAVVMLFGGEIKKTISEKLGMINQDVTGFQVD